MQESHTNKNPDDFDDALDLQEIFQILFKAKWIIVFVTAFISIAGVIYSLLLPNIYESKALLAPVNPSSSVSGALGSYASLAGLAGISLPSGGAENNSKQAIKKITSLSFFEENILKNIFLPDLMAVESWDSVTNTMIYDESIYQISKNNWVRDYSYPQKQVPSAQESYEAFVSKHLSLIEDKSSGYFVLSIKHQSPFIAKTWAELVVREVNAFYRQQDKSESERATSYLNQQILITNLSEVKQVLAQLLQEETKKLTLIEANEFYVFNYIDPPAIMEQKSEPKRALICIISSIIGGILSILLVLIKYYFFRNNKQVLDDSSH